MADFSNVCIAIQARSTSSRLPRKVFATIGDRSMLQHVIDAAERCARYMNNMRDRQKILVSTVLAVPTGDEIVAAVKNDELRGRFRVFQGSEHDVLARYAGLAERFSADYIVRITSDCPLIPDALITKHIKNAVINGYDYYSNVHEEVRMAPDGWDCEVISKKLLAWANENATDPYHRQHVTSYLRQNPPEWAKSGFTMAYLPLAHLKYSVDTQEELDTIRLVYDEISKRRDKARSLFGKSHVHLY